MEGTVSITRVEEISFISASLLAPSMQYDDEIGYLNSSPNDKILDLSKKRVFADDKSKHYS